MITSEQLAADGTEDGQQKALLHALAIHVRPTFPLIDLIYHVPNGGSRGASRKEAMMNGAKMKQLGVKRGVPDLCLPLPYCGHAALYIEMKKPKDGKLSDDQKSRIALLTQAHNFCAVIDDWQVGLQLIVDYLALAPTAFNVKYAIHEVAPSVLVFDPSGYYR